MDQMTPADLIREGRNKLFELGWTQGRLQHPSTKAVCARGALYAAAFGVRKNNSLSWTAIRNADRGIQEVCEGAEAALSEAGPRRIIGGIPYYNDQHGRTFDEIIEWFDKAEKIAEERHGE